MMAPDASQVPVRGKIRTSGRFVSILRVVSAVPITPPNNTGHPIHALVNACA